MRFFICPNRPKCFNETANFSDPFEKLSDENLNFLRAIKIFLSSDKTFVNLSRRF